jgi:hypothetical protein
MDLMSGGGGNGPSPTPVTVVSPIGNPTGGVGPAPSVIPTSPVTPKTPVTPTVPSKTPTSTGTPKTPTEITGTQTVGSTGLNAAATLPVFSVVDPITDYICPQVVQVYKVGELKARDIRSNEFK